MWTRPQEIVFGSALWITECANPYFVLQRRKGHGTAGLSSLVVGTIDSILDTRPPPYRLLLETSDSEVSYQIATATSRREIGEHWDWLERHLLSTLHAFESSTDAYEYVKGKLLYFSIESLVSESGTDQETLIEDAKCRSVQVRFRRLFNVPLEERLVNYYSCCYWNGKLPSQGHVYLSVNYLCFYSYYLGRQTVLKIRWTDVLKLEKNTKLVLPQSITVSAKDGKQYHFSMFLNFDETHKLMAQLANIALNHLMLEEGFEMDSDIVQKKSSILSGISTKKSKRRKSVVKRDLDARARTENYRSRFRVPLSEKLDGDCTCSLWTPYNKQHVTGKMYLSQNYVCFQSKVDRLVTLVVPCSELLCVEKFETTGEAGISNGLLMTTKSKMTFLLTNFQDRETVLTRLTAFLARLADRCETPSDILGLSGASQQDTAQKRRATLISRESRSSEERESEILMPALMHLFTIPRSNSQAERLQLKEERWNKHFSDFGRKENERWFGDHVTTIDPARGSSGPTAMAGLGYGMEHNTRAMLPGFPAVTGG